MEKGHIQTLGKFEKRIIKIPNLMKISCDIRIFLLIARFINIKIIHKFLIIIYALPMEIIGERGGTMGCLLH